MKGWFDAFRCNGGPTLYYFNNRTAVTGDISFISIVTIFSTLYVAFLIVFPGIRKERFNTFFSVTLSVFLGCAILVSLYGTGWHVGKGTAVTNFKTYSNEKMNLRIGVHIGLKYINVTLESNDSINKTVDIDYNERFYLSSNDEMNEGFKEALTKGLPFPILTVIEYFNIGQGGLSWGPQYHLAGYFATVMLWFSLALWILMNLMLVIVPRYGVILMTICGLMLLATVCGYLRLLPENPLSIHIDGTLLNFELGWCFWLLFLAGCISFLSGVTITIIEIFSPHTFSTIFEVDYDTPFDRHVIIEANHERHFRKCTENSANKSQNVIINNVSSQEAPKSCEKKSPSKNLNIYNQNFLVEYPFDTKFIYK